MSWLIIQLNNLMQSWHDLVQTIHRQGALIVSGQHFMLSLFTNRELALGLWIIIVASVIFISSNTREAATKVIRAATHKKLLTAIVCMSIYVVTMIYFLFYIGFWETYLIKDTIIWFMFSGIIGAFTAIGKVKNFNFFITTIRDSLSLALLVEFITNLYSFGLLVEFVLIPLVTLIVVCSTILDISPEFQNPESQPVIRFFGCLNIAIGLAIFSHSIKMISVNLRMADSIHNLKSLLLAPVLSIMFLGFIYFFVLWSSYEQIFIRLGFGEKKSKHLVMYMKFRILMYCHINLNKVNDFWSNGGVRLLAVQNKSDVQKVIQSCKNKGMESEAYL